MNIFESSKTVTLTLSLNNIPKSDLKKIEKSLEKWAKDQGIFEPNYDNKLVSMEEY